MLTGKAQAATAPTALGSLLQAATYGQTIPIVYGMTMSPLLAIWAANLRQGGSTKKFKQLKKGITAYVENIDFLIGHNPIMGVQQMWNNGAPIPLTFTSQTFSAESFSTGHFTVTDANFYAVIGVTLVQNYSVTFNDYGGTGSQTLTGSYEVPLWNELQTGPDPTNPNSYRNYPWVYRWQPSYGAEIFVDGVTQGQIPVNPTTANLKVYYTQLTAATSNLPPLQKMRLAFEPELGSGSEYADADLSAQQIIYPMFAGAGSSDIDLGSGGAIPQLQAEIQGKFGLYATGDGDFADMIEDVVKSGIAQAAIGADTSYSRVEHGLSGYNFPGTVQKKVVLGFENSAGTTVTFNSPNTAGNVLVAFVDVGQANDTTVPATISDSLGNTWVQAGTGSRSGSVADAFTWTMFYCVNCIAGANTITFGNVTYFDAAQNYIVMELVGVDTFDGFTSSVGSAAACSLTTTNVSPLPEILIAISLQQNIGAGQASPGNTTLWPATISPVKGGDHDGYQFMQQRNVTNPGSYSLAWQPNPVDVPTAGSYMVMIAFKATNPSPSPYPVSDFMDLTSLNQVRLQCRANGLYGSLSMNSQQSASDWLTTLYAAADAAPVFLGFKLYSYPYSEVSAVGNGATYTATTATGPLANLSDLNGDFVGQNVPVQIKTAARVNQPNVLQMQCINRTSNYNPSLVEQPDAASISLFGIRKQDPITNNAIQDVSIARQLLGIQVRKLQYGGDSYTFTMSAKWCLFAPMDLITVTDSLADIIAIPVRITSITENSDLSLSCQAEPFVYGMYAPTVFSTTAPVPFTPNVATTAGNVNPPIIFEPTPALYGLGNQAELWVVVSSGDANYGGCQVFVSTDGGDSYVSLGDPIMGNATTGYSTADWPASASPDTTNDLPLDLTESNGVLQSYPVSTEDGLVYPCYIAKLGSSQNAVGALEYIISRPSGTPGFISDIGVLFSGFNTPAAIPYDAVIQGIYPVCSVVCESNSNDSPTFAFGAASGMTPLTGGTLFTVPSAPFTTQQVYGASIGTSVDAIPAQAIRASEAKTFNDNQAGGTVISNIGYAVYYTSAVPSIDPQIAPPFAVPSGQGIAWAIPSAVTTSPTDQNNGGALIGAAAGATLALPVYQNGGVNTAGAAFESTSATVTGNAVIDTVSSPFAHTFNNPGGGGTITVTSSAPSAIYNAGTNETTIGPGVIEVSISQGSGNLVPIDCEITNCTWSGTYTVGAGSPTAFGLSNSTTTLSPTSSPNATVLATPAVQDGTIPYELMNYGVATLTATDKYTLMATGSGNHLNRAILGAPSSGVGVDHISGSRWAFLSPDGTGILKVSLPANWIGQQLFFKILSFNTFAGAAQSLSNVAFYTYTPNGASGSGVQLFQVNGS